MKSLRRCVIVLLIPFLSAENVRDSKEPRTYFKPNLSANGKNPFSCFASGSYALAWVCFTRPGVITPHAPASSALENLRHWHRVSHDAEGKESGYNSKDGGEVHNLSRF